MLDWIFEGVANWIASIMTELMDAVSGLFLDALGTNMTAMEEYFPFMTSAFTVIQYAAWALLFLIVVWQLFRNFGGPLTEAESPWQLLIRGALFAFLISYAKPIFSIALDIARAPYTALMDSTMDPGDFTFAGVEQALINGLVSFISLATVVGLILRIIMMIALAWNYFKLLLETVERYVLVGVLCYTSPLAYAMGASKSTSRVFQSWCRMVGSQLLLLVLNVWFLRAFNSSVGQFVANGGALTTGQGSVFLWEFCALALLKVAQKCDSYLAALGLSVAQTGSSMGMEMLMAARVITGFSKGGAQTAGSAFGGGGKAAGSAGGPSPAGGGGIGGFVSGIASKYKPNSFVRDAVVNGGSHMGAGGSVGFVGRMFGGMAARSGATLTAESVASVANRAPNASGTIAGDIADRSLGNFMPHLADTAQNTAQPGQTEARPSGEVRPPAPDIPAAPVVNQEQPPVPGGEQFAGAGPAPDFVPPEAMLDTGPGQPDAGIPQPPVPDLSGGAGEAPVVQEPVPAETMLHEDAVQPHTDDVPAPQPGADDHQTPESDAPDAPEQAADFTPPKEMLHNEGVEQPPVGNDTTEQFGGGVQQPPAPDMSATQGPGAIPQGGDTSTSHVGGGTTAQPDAGTSASGPVQANAPAAHSPLTGFSFSDTQITGGHISTTATAPDGRQASVDLYSAAQYERPECPHTVVNAADGSHWYQVASGDAMGAFYASPGFTGSAAETGQVSQSFPSAPGGTMLRQVDEGTMEASYPNGSGALWYNSAFYQEPDAPHETVQGSNGLSWYAMTPNANLPPFEPGEPASAYNQAVFEQFMPGFDQPVSSFDSSRASDGVLEVKHGDGSGTAFYDCTRYQPPRGDYHVFEDSRGSQWYAIPGTPAVERRPVYENGKPVYDGDTLRTVNVETVRYKATPTKYTGPKARPKGERKPPKKKT